MKFEKDQSGNPAVRPPGSRNKATILAEAMFQGEAETIIRMPVPSPVVYRRNRRPEARRAGETDRGMEP